MSRTAFRPVWEDAYEDNGERGAASPGITLGALWKFMGWPQRSLGAVAGKDLARCPDWPPDLFALTAAALRKSGAYTLAIKHIIDRHRGFNTIATGMEWYVSLSQEIAAGRQTFSVPAALIDLWAEIAQPDIQSLPLSRLMDDRRVAATLICLLAAADQACKGVGLPTGKTRSSFHDAADQLLFPSQFGSTLCRYIHPSAGRVLPKMHTAQSGLTIRSFSHHLAFCETDEVQPSWLSIPRR